MTRRRTATALLLLALCLGSARQAADRPPGSVVRSEPEILPGRPFAEAMAGGESRSYRIRIASGQYCRIAVEQMGIDVELALFGPGAEKLAEIQDIDNDRGEESLAVIAEVSGWHRLAVRAHFPEAVPGRYVGRIAELREAVATDRIRIAGDRAYMEGLRLRAEGATRYLGTYGKDVAVELPNERADVYFRQALEKFAAARSAWERVGDRRGVARADYAGANVRHWLGEHREAIAGFLDLLPRWRSLDDAIGEGMTLSSLGVAYSLAGEHAAALEAQARALAHWRQVGDRRRQARALEEIGNSRFWLDDPRRALAAYTQALALWRAERDAEGEAWVLQSMASAYRNQDDLRQALACHEQALPLWRRLGHRQGEAGTLRKMGEIHAWLGDKQRSLDLYDAALPLFRAAGDPQGEANVLNLMAATIDLPLGAWEQAIGRLERAIPIWQTLGDRPGEGEALLHLAIAWQGLGQPEKALDPLRQALARFRAVEDRHGEALTLARLGEASRAAGDLTAAQDLLQQARAISRTLPGRRVDALVLSALGRRAEDAGELEMAREHFEQARALWQALGDRLNEAGTLESIARVLHRQGEPRSALARAERAIELTRSLGLGLFNEDLEFSLTSARLRPEHELLVALLMQLDRQFPGEGYAARAFAASEEARARSLAKALREARSHQRRGADATLLASERRLRERILAKEEARVRWLAGPQATEKAAAAAREIDELLVRHRRLEARIAAANPREAAWTSPAALTLAEVRREVVDPETLLLEYFLGEERSFLWAVTAGSTASFELPGQDEVEKAARRLYRLLTARGEAVEFETAEERSRRLARAAAELPQAADALSRMLLGPVAHLLPGRRLAIVADGALQYLPFSVLPDPAAPTAGAPVAGAPAGVPLIVSHEVVVLPSASVLPLLRERSRRTGRAQEKTLAVLADPVFSDGDPRVRKAGSGKRRQGAREPGEAEPLLTRSARDLGLEGFERLPFSRLEAEAIARLVPAAEQLKALDFTASRTTAMGTGLERYRILHLATHGLLNNRNPELSGLVLSLVDEQGRPQQGFLVLQDIYNLELAADLVVLSACQTALGREVRGEGLVGLVRGFFYAGAPAVVASLWSPQDQATAELMARFYRGILTQGLPPAAALRAAQVSLWREERWRDPYFWGAFVLQGDWTAVHRTAVVHRPGAMSPPDRRPPAPRSPRQSPESSLPRELRRPG